MIKRIVQSSEAPPSDWIHDQLERLRLLPCTPYELCLHLHSCFLEGEFQRSKLFYISKWHKERGLTDPTKHPAVWTLGKIICDELDVHKTHTPPMKIAELAELLRTYETSPYLPPVSKSHVPRRMKENSILRDKAALLVAFWAGMSIKQVCTLQRSNIILGGDYFKIMDLPNANTANTGNGFRFESFPELCPVQALRDWLNISGAEEAIFPAPSVISRSLREFAHHHGFRSVYAHKIQFSLLLFLISMGWPLLIVCEALPFYEYDFMNERIRKYRKFFNDSTKDYIKRYQHFESPYRAHMNKTHSQPRGLCNIKSQLQEILVSETFQTTYHPPWDEN